jgi:hypothetical protein
MSTGLTRRGWAQKEVSKRYKMFDILHNVSALPPAGRLAGWRAGSAPVLTRPEDVDAAASRAER